MWCVSTRRPVQINTSNTNTVQPGRASWRLEELHSYISSSTGWCGPGCSWKNLIQSQSCPCLGVTSSTQCTAHHHVSVKFTTLNDVSQSAWDLFFFFYTLQCLSLHTSVRNVLTGLWENSRPPSVKFYPVQFVFYRVEKLKLPRICQTDSASHTFTFGTEKFPQDEVIRAPWELTANIFQSKRINH